MIDAKTALRHVESFRFANLDFAPDSEGTKALAKMLAKHALSSEHAAAVAQAWIAHWPKWPRPADIRQFCETVTDPRMAQAAQAREGCPRCQGTGFVTVEGPCGLSAAYPCSHQPESEADQRMGIRVSPMMARHYLAEQAEARKRRVAFMRRRADGKAPGFSRVDQSDVDALMKTIEEPV